MIGSSKLTEERARIVKALLRNGEHTHQQIADLCNDLWGVNISRELVTKINLNQRWNAEIRSFEMKDTQDKPKRSNDYRQFTNTPTKRELTEGDMEVIKTVINQLLNNNK